MRIASISTQVLPKQRINFLSPQNNSVNPSFRGQQFPSGYYDDEEIALAKRFINQTGDEWRKAYRDESVAEFGELYSKSHGANWILGTLARIFGGDSIEECSEKARLVFDISTLGVWELANAPVSLIEASIKKMLKNGQIDKKTARVATLICDMQKEEAEKNINNELTRMEKIIQEQKGKYNTYVNLDKLERGFINCVQDEKEGIDTVIPNAIMIKGNNKEQGEEFVDYARKKSGVYFATVKEGKASKMQKDLYEALNEAKAKYDETGNRTLIEVKGMDKLVSKKTEFKVTEWMKAVLTACAEDYKATVVFQTENPDNMIEEINVPHRVGVNLETD